MEIVREYDALVAVAEAAATNNDAGTDIHRPAEDVLTLHEAHGWSVPQQITTPSHISLKAKVAALAAIGQLLDQGHADLGRLIAVQIKDLDSRAAELAATRVLLVSIQSRLATSVPIWFWKWGMT